VAASCFPRACTESSFKIWRRCTGCGTGTALKQFGVQRGVLHER